MGDTTALLYRLDEAARAFTPAERRVAVRLAADGAHVVALAQTSSPGRADALVDGVETAFETLGQGASTAAVAIALSRTVRHARHAILDVRGTGLSESAVRQGVARFRLTPQSAHLDTLRAIGGRFDLTW